MSSPMVEAVAPHLFRSALDSQGVIRSPLLRRKRDDSKDVVVVKDNTPHSSLQGIIPPIKLSVQEHPLRLSSQSILRIREDLPLCVIGELPNDVLAIIFSFVSLSTVPSIFRTCRRWAKCVRDHSWSLWKFWFESHEWMVRDKLKVDTEVKKRRLDWKAVSKRHMEVERGWAKGDPRCIREVKHAHERIIISIECDEARIVSGSLDKTVKIWDRNNASLLKTLDHDAPVQCFQFKGNQLVSGAKDITIWNMDAGKRMRTYRSPFPCNALKFNDKELVYGDSQAIYFCDMETGVPKNALDENYLRALILADNLLISGHMFDMKGWDMRTYENTWKIPCGASTNCMQLGSNKLFSFVAGGKTLNVHDLRVMKKFATVDEDIIFGLSLDCNKLVTANPFYIKVWDVTTMTEKSLCLPPSKRTGYFSYVHTLWDQMICGESCSPSILVYDF